MINWSTYASYWAIHVCDPHPRAELSSRSVGRRRRINRHGLVETRCPAAGGGPVPLSALINSLIRRRQTHLLLKTNIIVIIIIIIPFSSSSSSSSAAARHNDQQVKAQKLLKSLLPPGVNTKNMSPVQIQAMLNRYNNMSSILHVAHEDELKNHANSGFKGTAILNGERYDLNGTHYELHPNFANPDRNQRPKPIFIPSEPNTGVDAGIQPPINADFRKGANKGGSIVDSRGIKHEPGGTITTGNNKSQNINSSTSTKKRPTGYDLPSSITSSIHNKNNKIGAMATPNSKSDAHLKPDVDAQAVGPQPPAAVDGVAKAAGTAAVGTAEKRNFCEGHEDPFASQPVDTFVTPKEATFEEAMEWKNALKKMVNKISKMKIGGETLREAIREEVTALQIMRFKMFCKYA
mmetsp:Transcript_25755/g.43209  ORF Transcript_25755/g.43209 Transcript_25755/m.43209 type:complete len:406 (-) Transcript_25755:2386-3603(-)